eukprot:2390619-Amphidinium_carterae.1
MPVPTREGVGWDPWVSLAIYSGPDWRSLVLSYAKSTAQTPTVADGAAHDFVPLDRPPDCWWCEVCSFAAKTLAGLHAHTRIKHEVHGWASLRVRDTTCPSCFADYGTRARVLQHLHRCTQCALWALSLPPMEQDELRAVLKRGRTDNRHARMLVPRRGPKPLALTPTTNMVEPLWYHQLLDDFLPPVY